MGGGDGRTVVVGRGTTVDVALGVGVGGDKRITVGSASRTAVGGTLVIAFGIAVGEAVETMVWKADEAVFVNVVVATGGLFGV
jgi:hypothetical protein